jgi:hypothetical protein
MHSHLVFFWGHKLSKVSIKIATNLGIAGVAVMSPSFFKPRNAREMGEVIAAVAREVPEVPFYYYHFPDMNGLNVRFYFIFLLSTKFCKINKYPSPIQIIKFPVIDTLTHARSLSSNVIGCKYTATDCADIGRKHS